MFSNLQLRWEPLNTPRLAGHQCKHKGMQHVQSSTACTVLKMHDAYESSQTQRCSWRFSWSACLYSYVLSLPRKDIFGEAHRIPLQDLGALLAPGFKAVGIPELAEHSSGSQPQTSSLFVQWTCFWCFGMEQIFDLPARISVL